MDTVNQNLLQKVVERSEYPILIIHPWADFYEFLEMEREKAVSFGFPENIEQKVEIINSIRNFDENKNYALILSGIYGFEVSTRDIEPKDYSKDQMLNSFRKLENEPQDYSTDQAFDLFSKLGEREIPVATLTQCCEVNAMRQLEDLSNLLFLGLRPTDYMVFSYIFNCYTQQKNIPLQEFVDSERPLKKSKDSWKYSSREEEQFALQLKAVERVLGKKINL